MKKALLILASLLVCLSAQASGLTPKKAAYYFKIEGSKNFLSIDFVGNTQTFYEIFWGEEGKLQKASPVVDLGVDNQNVRLKLEDGTLIVIPKNENEKAYVQLAGRAVRLTLTRATPPETKDKEADQSQNTNAVAPKLTELPEMPGEKVDHISAIGRSVHALLKIENTDSFVYVDFPEEVDSDFDAYLKKIRVFVGKPGDYKLLKTTSFVAYRDGGTFIIQFENGGTIYVPAPNNTELKATFTVAKDGTVLGLQRLPKDRGTVQSTLKIITEATVKPKHGKSSNLSNTVFPRTQKINAVYESDDGHILIVFADDFKGNEKLSSRLFWGMPNTEIFFQVTGQLDFYKHPTDKSLSRFRFKVYDLSKPDKGEGNIGTFVLEKNGLVHFVCSNGKKCFSKEWTEKEIQELEKKIQYRGWGNFFKYPDIRAAKFLFQIADENRFIYIDNPIFNGTHYDAEVFIGEPGKLEQVGVTHIEYFLDGGTTMITLKDGSEINIPQTAFDPENIDKATYKNKALKRIVDISEKTLLRLGIDPVRVTPVLYLGSCMELLLQSKLK